MTNDAGVLTRRQHDGDDRQIVFAREVEVALVAAGQPKMAPVPYSISTKFAIQTGTKRSSNGWRTVNPVS